MKIGKVNEKYAEPIAKVLSTHKEITVPVNSFTSC